MWFHAAGVASLAIVSGIAYVLAIQPMLNQRRQLLTVEQENASLQAQAAGLESTTKQWQARRDEYLEAVQRISIRLEPIQKQNERISRISNLAESVGLRLDLFEPGKAATVAGKIKVPFNLLGKGTTDAAAKLLSELNTQFPDTRIVTLGIREAQGAETQISMEMIWHALSSTAASPRPAPTAPPSSKVADAPEGGSR